MNAFPGSRTHPTRTPFSTGVRFIDTKGPSPYEFFDEAQDNLGAACHAQLLTDWSGAGEDFERPILYPSSSFIGDFRIVTNTDIAAGAGLTLTSANAQEAGEHGVWSFLSGVNGWIFEMQTGSCHVGTDDFLITCRLRVVSRAALSPMLDTGIVVSCGAIGDIYPSFIGGSDQENWFILARPAPLAFPHFYNTGVPMLDASNALGVKGWYTLQISRVSGAVRFFINGRLIMIEGKEGLYLPDSMPSLRRYLGSRAWHATAANQGFYLDYFHRLCRRG